MKTGKATKNSAEKTMSVISLSNWPTEGDLKFRLSAMLYKGVSESRDYGDGEPLKMLDAHILVDIDKYPGILSADLAQRWCRTRSAIASSCSGWWITGTSIRSTCPATKRNARCSARRKEKISAACTGSTTRCARALLSMTCSATARRTRSTPISKCLICRSALMQKRLLHRRQRHGGLQLRRG